MPNLGLWRVSLRARCLTLSVTVTLTYFIAYKYETLDKPKTARAHGLPTVS